MFYLATATSFLLQDYYKAHIFYKIFPITYIFFYGPELTKMSRNMTKPTKWLCPQRRLRSAWASTQSDQSSPALNGWLRTQAYFMRTAKTDQTGQMPRLIWVFAGHTFILFVLLKWNTRRKSEELSQGTAKLTNWHLYPVKIKINLPRHKGWSEALLGSLWVEKTDQTAWMHRLIWVFTAL